MDVSQVFVTAILYSDDDRLPAEQTYHLQTGECSLQVNIFVN